MAVCLATDNTPPVLPLQPWTWSARPWRRTHVDYAEKDGVYFLVLVDSHSKWIEVFEMLTTLTQKTIDKHRYFFGLPEEIVSDNLPQFKSCVQGLL